MKKLLLMMLCIAFAFAFCACADEKPVATAESATAENAGEETADAETTEESGGLTLVETIELDENEDAAEPKEPLGNDFQALEDRYTEHYDAVLSGVTAYAGQMMGSAEGMANAIADVLLYFNTEDTLAHITAMEEIVVEMEASAASDAETEKAAGDKTALQIYKDIQAAQGNWDNMTEEEQQTVMAYIMALAMSQTTEPTAEPAE